MAGRRRRRQHHARPSVLRRQLLCIATSLATAATAAARCASARPDSGAVPLAWREAGNADGAETVGHDEYGSRTDRERYGPSSPTRVEPAPRYPVPAESAVRRRRLDSAPVGTSARRANAAESPLAATEETGASQSEEAMERLSGRTVFHMAEPSTRPSPASPAAARSVYTRCNVDTFSCCQTSDCGRPAAHGEAACFNRHCLRTSFCLQFVLEWIGPESMYGLYALAPGGVELGRANPLDDDSGGCWSQQSTSEYVVQDVAFDSKASCDDVRGSYTYFVMADQQSDVSWDLTVLADGDIVSTRTGNGPSGRLAYSYRSDAQPSEPSSSPSSRPSPIPTSVRSEVPSYTPSSRPSMAKTATPDLPTMLPTQTTLTTSPADNCSVDDSTECCGDDDCDTSVETCTNRNCVKLGSPRFTLTWIGDGDNDLVVRTPQNTFISFQQQFDDRTGGRLEKDVSPDGPGYYAENVYFVSADLNRTDAFTPPGGLYECTVLAGDDSMAWKLIIGLDRAVIREIEGVGDRQITYMLDNGNASTDAPVAPSSTPTGTVTLPPTVQCDANAVGTECCQSSQCVAEDTTCANRNCITEGALRFTLSWVGTDDKDLRVTTATNNLIFFGDSVDTESGGRLEEDVSPDAFGYHTENIYFPVEQDIPFGVFRYGVSVMSDEEPWEATVFIGGELQERRRGIGNSADFWFTYTGTRDPNGVSTVTISESSIIISQNRVSGSDCVSSGVMPTIVLAVIMSAGVWFR